MQNRLWGIDVQEAKIGNHSIENKDFALVDSFFPGIALPKENFVAFQKYLESKHDTFKDLECKNNDRFN